jgi:hypothetical protein
MTMRRVLPLLFLALVVFVAACPKNPPPPKHKAWKTEPRPVKRHDPPAPRHRPHEHPHGPHPHPGNDHHHHPHPHPHLAGPNGHHHPY